MEEKIKKKRKRLKLESKEKKKDWSKRKEKGKKNLPKPGIVQNSFEFSGLNQGPSDLQSDALPTELFRLFV